MPNAFDALAAVIEERFAQHEPRQAERARDATQSPADQLGHLAWSRGLDYWESSWSESQKREIISLTPLNLRRRGTIGSIKYALASLVGEVELVEWFNMDPVGDRCTGDCTIDEGSYLETDASAQQTVARVLARESRGAMHWTLIAAVTAEPVLGVEEAARFTTLHQFSGVQTGA